MVRGVGELGGGGGVIAEFEVSLIVGVTDSESSLIMVRDGF